MKNNKKEEDSKLQVYNTCFGLCLSICITALLKAVNMGLCKDKSYMSLGFHKYRRCSVHDSPSTVRYTNGLLCKESWIYTLLFSILPETLSLDSRKLLLCIFVRYLALLSSRALTPSTVQKGSCPVPEQRKVAVSFNGTLVDVGIVVNTSVKIYQETMMVILGVIYNN